MFISYFEPFKTRNEEAFDINFFYSQVYNFKGEDVLYVTNKFYFKDIEYYRKTRPSFGEDAIKGTTKYYCYEFPSNEDISSLDKRFIDESLFEPLFKKYGNDCTKVERFLLTSVYEPLFHFFDSLLQELNKQNRKVETILIIKNCPSIEKAARRYGIPVLHYEIAPFRNPMYMQTAYMDFSGVNGKTEVLSRFAKFKDEYQKTEVEVFSKEELLSFLKIQEEKRSLKDFINTLKTRKYKIGLAGQVYNDSNLIAFSEGFDGKSSLDFLLKKFNSKDILVRNHPGNPTGKNLDFKNVDHSSNSYEFVKRCKNIVTINSSVGIEAILLDRNAYILGDSPFKFLSKDIDKPISDEKVQDELLKLNFFIFGYLIPFENLFDASYIRWRLTFPSEVEIYNKNLHLYREARAMPSNVKSIESYLECIQGMSNAVNMKDMYLWPNTLVGKSDQNIIKQRVGASDYEIDSKRSRPHKIIKALKPLIHDNFTVLDITCADAIVISKIKYAYPSIHVYGMDCAKDEFVFESDVINSGIKLYKGYIQHLFRTNPQEQFDLSIMLNTYRGWNSAFFKECDKDIPEAADRWFINNSVFTIVTATKDQIKLLRKKGVNVKIIGKGESDSIMIMFSKTKKCKNDIFARTKNYYKYRLFL